MNHTTYYKRNRDVLVNKKNIVIKIIKKNYENKQEINIGTYLKKKKF